MPVTLTTALHNSFAPALDWYLMPEAFSAGLVEQAMARYGLGPGDTILDPFSGTGTTVLAAKLAGLNGLGLEANPFLAWAAGVKLGVEVSPLAFGAAAQRVAARIGELADAPAVPLPDMPRIAKWMTPVVAYKIMALKAAILEEEAGPERELLLLALAAILRPAGNLKLTAHAFGSVERKDDAPVGPMFTRKTAKILADLQAIQASGLGCLGRAEVVHADSRDLGGLSHSLLPAQLAITSPPYLNNLDYTMQTRLELFFLDHVRGLADVKAIRKGMVICDAKAMYRDIADHQRVEGFQSIQAIAEAIAVRHAGKNWGWDYPFMTRQYFGGLHRVLEGARNALAPGARFILVVGESSHSGVKVPVPEILGEMGEQLGYHLEAIEIHRLRRSSSHRHELAESSVILRV